MNFGFEIVVVVVAAAAAVGDAVVGWQQRRVCRWIAERPRWHRRWGRVIYDEHCKHFHLRVDGVELLRELDGRDLCR